MNELSRELRRGTLELILLQLLSQREMYGYEIVKELETKSEGSFQTQEGTLYPVLYRLEDQGYITHRWENPRRGVPRKYYGLTSEGKLYLEKLKREWELISRFVHHILKTKGEPDEEE